MLHFSDRDTASFLAPLGIRDLGKGRANDKLLETAANFKPELILLGHCDIIRNRTLEAIRLKLPEVKIAYRNVDPLFVPRNVEAIHRRTSVVDSIFITTGGSRLKQFEGGRAEIHYMANPCDPAVEIYDNSQKEDLPVDLFFCGNSNEHTERTEIVTFLKKELVEKITFRTPGYDGEPNVWADDYNHLLSQSRMGLNLNRQEDELYSSARLAQLMGNGILAFIDRASGMETLIPEDCAAYYSGRNELLERILEFANDDARRREVAGRGREHYHANFSSTAIAAEIVRKTFGNHG